MAPNLTVSAMIPIEIRKMAASDIDAVFSILVDVADSIPVSLNTEDRRNAMRLHIRNRYIGDYSLVAADDVGRVLGFQLAERRQLFVDVEGICLDYAGVSETARQNGIFREFIRREQRHGFLLRAEVLPGNTSGTGSMLIRYGFRLNGKTEYLWEPNATLDSNFIPFAVGC